MLPGDIELMHLFTSIWIPSSTKSKITLGNMPTKNYMQTFNTSNIDNDNIIKNKVSYFGSS